MLKNFKQTFIFVFLTSLGCMIHFNKLSHPELINDIAQDIQKTPELSHLGKIQRAKGKLVQEISSKWKISNFEATSILENVIQIAQENSMDPILILSVIAEESAFQYRGNPNDFSKNYSNINPENPHGLMQIAGRWHRDKFPEGIVAITTDLVNLKIGTQILKEHLLKESGDIRRALHRYNGSLNDPTQKYSRNVISKSQYFMKIVDYSNQI